MLSSGHDASFLPNSGFYSDRRGDNGIVHSLRHGARHKLTPAPVHPPASKTTSDSSRPQGETCSGGFRPIALRERSRVETARRETTFFIRLKSFQRFWSFLGFRELESRVSSLALLARASPPLPHPTPCASGWGAFRDYRRYEASSVVPWISLRDFTQLGSTNHLRHESGANSPFSRLIQNTAGLGASHGGRSTLD